MSRPSFTLFFLVLLIEGLNVSRASAQFFDQGGTFEGRVVVGSHAIGGASALQDKLYGVDLSFQQDISHITDNWVKMAGVRAAGLSVIFRDLQDLKGYQDTSANSFGQAYGLAGHMDFRLADWGSGSLTLRPGIGLSYLSKTFFTDKRNRFIGSHLNEIVKLDLLVQVPVNQKVELTAGAGFLHYSNGGFVIPNGGINMLSVSTGIRLKREDPEKKEYHTRFRQLNRNNFELNLGVGRRGVFESRKGLLKSGLYAGYNLFLNDLISLKSGFDAVYYYTPFDPAPGRDIQTFQYYGTSFDKWRAGVSGGAEIAVWRLALNAQLGKYLYYNSYYPDVNWFWTSGLTYYVAPRVGLQAKTYFHKSQADFINYGLVFKI
ncbi:acyloxyacyl hydrolase [Flavihumibacter sp. R14]|nr:acyloxyacyl hydrolase [Flavihumibacter soli]